MAEVRDKKDKRSETRRPVGGRIFWKKPGRNARHMGWLNNTSVSSASFITEASVQPQVGDQVELTDFYNSTKRCKVTRTAPYGGQLSLVACDSVAPDTSG